MQEIDAACWAELERAATEPGHAWRLMALATVDGDAADLRHVVLRESRPAERSLIFYTDARSPKVAQLAAHPLGTLLLWSRALRWQLRLRCRFYIAVDGAEVAARWQQLKATPAALDYLSPLAPGQALQAPLPEPTHEGHFALVTARVERLDWLELHDDGLHRRALIDAEGARWVAP
nr:pyridoxamine 5'-phosphate oxidase family protein [Aquabacterium terrae]